MEVTVYVHYNQIIFKNILTLSQNNQIYYHFDALKAHPRAMIGLPLINSLHLSADIHLILGAEKENIEPGSANSINHQIEPGRGGVANLFLVLHLRVPPPNPRIKI